MDYIYLQPKYFTDFRCVGGECVNSCCDGWRVDWAKDEYEHLRSASMPEELKSKVDSDFLLKDDKYYYIKMCSDGRCPFHNRETDLCDIQKTIGAEYFGVTCDIYPRMYYRRDNMILRSCTPSCPAVLSMLMNDKDAGKLEKTLARNYKSINPYAVYMDSESEVANSRYLKFKLNIIEFYNDLFGRIDKIENAVTLGALAAKKISDLAVAEKENQIPVILKDLIKQFDNPATIRSVDQINVNYMIKFVITNNMAVKYFNAYPEVIKEISSLHDGTKLILENYLEGKEKFENIFENRPFVLKNIISNLFIDLFCKNLFTKGTFFDFYSYFTACSAVVAVLAYSVGYCSDDIENRFIHVCSLLFREILHNTEVFDSVITDMNNKGLSSPAHLALIIK